MLLENYQVRWIKDFGLIRKILKRNLQGVNCAVEHIGSTAVPGLCAKPIIDIDLIYGEESDFGKIKAILENLGYYHNGDQGIPGREVFKRRADHQPSSELDAISHHLYICHRDNPELKRHLIFRDCLRNNEMARNTYAKLKEEVAAKAGQDRKLYAELKQDAARDFVENTILKFESPDLHS